MDEGKVTAVTLLKLYAAFDIIDQSILLSRLQDWLGITGKALDWLESLPDWVIACPLSLISPFE